MKLAVKALIQDNLEESVELERICEKLVKKLKLTEEQTHAYMNEFM